MHRIFTTAFADVYPAYCAKLERKGRSEVELREVITWLTGYDDAAIDRAVTSRITFEQFFVGCTLNPNVGRITGSVCGVKVQEVQDPLMRRIRYLDKLVDELASGRPMTKVLRG